METQQEPRRIVESDQENRQGRDTTIGVDKAMSKRSGCPAKCTARFFSMPTTTSSDRVCCGTTNATAAPVYLRSTSAGGSRGETDRHGRQNPRPTGFKPPKILWLSRLTEKKTQLRPARQSPCCPRTRFRRRLIAHLRDRGQRRQRYVVARRLRARDWSTELSAKLDLDAGFAATRGRVPRTWTGTLTSAAAEGLSVEDGLQSRRAVLGGLCRRCDRQRHRSRKGFAQHRRSGTSGVMFVHSDETSNRFDAGPIAYVLSRGPRASGT